MSPVTIAEALSGEGLADATGPLATTDFPADNLAAEIDRMLEHLLVAESWESMAMRSVARSEPLTRKLVPVPTAARRRAA